MLSINIKEALPQSLTKRIVLCSFTSSIRRDGPFMPEALTSKTKRRNVAGPIVVEDVFKGTAYTPIFPNNLILLLLSISILAKRVFPTFTVGQLEFPLLGIICPSPDTFLGKDRCADWCWSTFESSVRRFFREGEREFTATCWETRIHLKICLILRIWWKKIQKITWMDEGRSKL